MITTPTTFVPGPELLDSVVGRTLFPPLPSSECSRHGRPGICPPGRSRVAVIGCGLAGTALFSALIDEGIAPDDIVLLDPAGRPTERFFRRASALGLTVLRSPYEHHIGPDRRGDCELVDVARAAWGELSNVERGEVRMAQASLRSVVPLDVFAAHCAMVAALHGVHERVAHAQADAVSAEGGGGYAVHHDRGVTHAEIVVWAVGQPARAVPEAWSASVPGAFRSALEVDPQRLPKPRHMGVVGAGLSGAHWVVRALDAGHEVTWMRRRPVEYRCADVNARYFRPEGRSTFLAQTPAGRQRLLRHERRPSVMFELRPALEAAREEQRLHDLVAPDLVFEPSRRLSVVGRAGGEATAPLDLVIAALGLEYRFSPPLDPRPPTDGRLPLLDDVTLEVQGRPGAFVLGALASLSIGPAAGNIDGIRFAVERVAPVIGDRLGRS